jgi:hypothetical protein
MASRWLSLGVLLVFLLAVPAGVYFLLTSPAMGYPKSTAGIISAVLALVGLTLVPLSLRRKAADSAAGQALPAKTGWTVLIAFLAIMIAVVAYFMLLEP